MATNPYLRNYTATNEQDLNENLIIESIKFHGMDVYYLPKTKVKFDEIYGEDSLMKFDRAIPLEMYIESIDSFSGDGQFLSKFNIEVRDQLQLSVARRRFKEEVTEVRPDTKRPYEGDLVYFPLNKKMFRIQYADEKAIFFQLGKLQTFKLTLEVFEYSHERFETGIPEIDVFNDLYTPAPGSPEEAAMDPFDDSIEIQAEADDLLDFSENNPFGDRIY